MILSKIRHNFGLLEYFLILIFSEKISYIATILKQKDNRSRHGESNSINMLIESLKQNKLDYKSIYGSFRDKKYKAYLQNISKKNYT